jgi:hypothetical protein
MNVYSLVNTQIPSNDNWINSAATSKTISQYLSQNDLTELSKVCKNYRAQLRPQVLKTMSISNIYQDKYRETQMVSFKSGRKVENTINRLRDDLRGFHSLVRKVILKLELPKQFTSEFFALFSEISHVVAYISQSSSLNNLIESLNSLTSIKHFTLYSIPGNFNTLGHNVNYKFFHSLNSIKLYSDDDIDDLEFPFSIVDSTFTNLKYLTITNNQTLSKLLNGLPSLICAEFFDGCDLNNAELYMFIINNPQLKEIAILSDYLGDDIINSILILQRLYKLRIIDRYSTNEKQLRIKTESYSLKHFTYVAYGYGYSRDSQNIVGIIKVCKNLKVFETDNSTLTSSFGTVINQNFPEINTILVNIPSYVRDISTLSKLTKFKELKFRNGFKFRDLYKFKRSWELLWEPKYEYSYDTNEFTLIRKSNS